MKWIKLALLAMTIFLPGCKILIPFEPPEAAIHYYRNPNANFDMVGRVVILEPENLSTNPKISEEMTAQFSEALQKRQIFGVDLLYRSDPAWQDVVLSSNSAYTKEQLTTIRDGLKTDAIIYGEILHYYPYPRMSVGIRLKLVDCRTGQLLWAIEQVWDSTDKTIEDRIDRFFKTEMRTGYDPMQSHLTMLSPRIFNKFVAHEIAQTLR